MNLHITLTTDFIRGYSRFTLPGQYLRSGEMHLPNLIFYNIYAVPLQTM